MAGVGGIGGLVGGRGLLAGTAFIDVRPNLSNFGAHLKTEMSGVLASVGNFGGQELEKSFAGVGASLSKIGGTLTKGLTVPIAGASVAAFTFGADFDAVLHRMIGLAGVGADEIDGIKQSLLGLAHETGRGPTDLANALYLVRSAGLDGAQAMQAVEVSAKASAAGMGETDTIASALVSTLNAYGKTGLTAAQAGDILTASVRDGAAEADQFAAVIGTVVPLAAQLGVGFDQVAASIAAMTKVGISADTASTNLTAIFSGLLRAGKDGSQASKALDAVGLSAKGLREELKQPQGIIHVLREIEDAFGGDEAAIQQVFPEIRALRGALGLLGQQQTEVNKVFADTANATGSLDLAFSEAQKSAKFKLERALADAKVALVDLGETLAPTGERIAGFASGAFQGFSKLPDPVKETTVGLLGLAAAAGPVSFLGGKIASGIGQVVGVAKAGGAAFSAFRAGVVGNTTVVSGKLQEAARSAGGFVNAIGPAGVAGGLAVVGGALAIGGIALENYLRKQEETRQRVLAFTDALRADSGALGENTRALILKELQDREQLDDLGRITPALSSHRAAIDVLTDAVGGNVDAQKEFRQALLDSGEVKAIASSRKALEEWIATGKEGGEAGSVIITGNKALAHEFNNLVTAQRNATIALQGTAGATRTAAQVDAELAAAKQHLADLEASGTASAGDLAAARIKVNKLGEEQRSIESGVQSALDGTTSAMKRQSTSVEDLAARNAVLAKAAAEVTKVQSAQADLAEARADVAGTGEKARAATERYTDALRSERDAARGAEDAAASLRKAQQQLAEFDDATSTRVRSLERTQIVDRVVTTPEEARQKEIDLLKFDQDNADKRRDLQASIADAERGVASAADRVADAQRGVAKAAEDRRQVQIDAAARIVKAENTINTTVAAVETSLKKVEAQGKTAMQPWIDALLKIDHLLDPNSNTRKGIEEILSLLPKPAPPFQPVTPIRRFAAGGSLPEGDSIVGEDGFEVARKHGSRVDIIPHPAAARAGGRTAAGSYDESVTIDVKQEINFHGNDRPAIEELDIVNRKLGMRLAASGLKARR